jgi:hypothetical protein
MILSLKQLGNERKILVNTDHIACIKGDAKGSKIVFSGVESTEREVWVVEAVEDIFSIFKK